MSTVSDSGREAMLPEAATETDAHDELIASDLSDNIPIILELPQSSSMDPKPFAPTITSHMPFGNIQKNLFSTTQDDDVLPLLSGAFQETQLVAAGSLPGMKVARGNDDMLGLLSGHFPTQMDVDEECASKNLPDSAGGSNLSHSDNEAGEIPNEDSEEEASNEESSDQTSLDEEEDVSDADDDVVANPKFLEDSDKEENDPSLDSVKLNGTETQTQDSVPWLPEEPSVPTVPRSVNFVLGMPPPPQPAAKRTNLFVETEADVEDDEFMNFGGKDGEDDGAMDQYDPEFVGEADKEVIEDFGDVIELHR